ncbi:MAG: hypothetical protein R3E83_15310 [Burkholderiaceae bacterium]
MPPFRQLAWIAAAAISCSFTAPALAASATAGDARSTAKPATAAGPIAPPHTAKADGPNAKSMQPAADTGKKTLEVTKTKSGEKEVGESSGNTKKADKHEVKAEKVDLEAAKAPRRSEALSTKEGASKR